MKKSLMITIALSAFLIIGCAAGPNPLVASNDVAGFWKGLWHGFIILFSFIISLFNDNVTIYEVNNNGGWYNFGFLFGAMMFWGGGGNKACQTGKSQKHGGVMAEVKEEIRKEIRKEIEKEFQKAEEAQEESKNSET